eukprot:637795-Prorocentrum_minimum.AAC.2
MNVLSRKLRRCRLLFAFSSPPALQAPERSDYSTHANRARRRRRTNFDPNESETESRYSSNTIRVVEVLTLAKHENVPVGSTTTDGPHSGYGLGVRVWTCWTRDELQDSGITSSRPWLESVGRLLRSKESERPTESARQLYKEQTCQTER